MRIEQTEAFEAWFTSLRDRRAQMRITARLAVIEANGHFGDHKPVGGDVFELRFHFGPGYRVYYALRGEELVLLLGGGDKDSQARDIARAKDMLKDLNEDG